MCNAKLYAWIALIKSVRIRACLGLSCLSDATPKFKAGKHVQFRPLYKPKKSGRRIYEYVISEDKILKQWKVWKHQLACIKKVLNASLSLGAWPPSQAASNILDCFV